MAVRIPKPNWMRKHLVIIISTSLFLTGIAFDHTDTLLKTVGAIMILVGLIGLIVSGVQEGRRWIKQPHYYSPSKPRTKRPKGVTVLGIFSLVGCILCYGGIQLLFQGSHITNRNFSVTRQIELNYFHQFLPTNLENVFSVVLIAIGAVLFFIGYGTLKGKTWAWKPLVMSYIVSMPLTIYETKDLSMFALATTVFSLVLNLVIIYYLYRPHVRAYFGSVTNQSFHGEKSAV